MNRYIQIDINVELTEQKEILLALLADIGYEGFEEDIHVLKAFISEEEFNEIELNDILQKTGLPYDKSIIPQTNWNEAWEASFEPVIVSDFCSVRAEFHLPITATEHDIIITPKMSFGTGHHATTLMMIESMRNISFQGQSVFDFGTGTGVLAILAEKMGAKFIEAIDHDDWSIENANENIRKNICRSITIRKSDFPPVLKSFDIILANINKNIILLHFHYLAQGLAKGGVIVLSGLLIEDVDDIKQAADHLGLEISGIQKMNNWACLQLIKPGILG